MQRLFCLLILFLFLAPACKSVDTFLQKNDVKGAANFCDSKTGKERSDCFDKLVKYHISNNDVKKAADIYQKIADETGNKTYFTKAADIHAAKGKPDLAVQLYLKAGNQSKAQKTMKDYLHKNQKNDRHKKFKFISEYSEKLELKDDYERLAEIAVKQKKFTAANSYRKKFKERQKNKNKWEKEGFKNLAKKNYRKAADCFLKANKPLLSRDAYISGAENALKKKKPRYKYAMKNYQMAGIEERGKKRAVTVMLDHHKFSKAFKLAKSVSSNLYTEALITAGDINLGRNFDKSVKYYKQAGLKDYYCRIGDFFLKGKKPDFAMAESWYSKSADNSCKSRLLIKAIQINDTFSIKKYSTY